MKFWRQDPTLSIAFLLSFTALILQTVLIPGASLLVFAPFLALLCMRTSLPKTLWLSAISGLVIDLFSSDPMGLHALNYTLTTAVLYRFRKHFSSSEALHLSVYTTLISCLATLWLIVLLFLFDRRGPNSGVWILTDLIGMPIVDGLYAFIWFAAPLALWRRVRRLWGLYWLKRKNPFPSSH